MKKHIALFELFNNSGTLDSLEGEVNQFLDDLSDEDILAIEFSDRCVMVVYLENSEGEEKE
jgi:hypothetical protein